MSGRAEKKAPAAKGKGKGKGKAKARPDDIAVVGLALRVPGAADLDAFWDLLRDGRCMIGPIPPDRWRGHPRLRAMAEAEAPETSWGAFLDDADAFDAPFFGISPREARTMDPQQRMILELSWQAMEDAGYAPPALAGSPTGVFMGVCHWDYAELFEKTGLPVDAYLPTGTAYSIIANRVSYWFDLTGPSVTNDTACASALVAVQQAAQALQSGACTAALAGAVNLIWSPNHFIAFHKNGMLSRQGRARAFDRRADGYVRGEGAAVLLLKTVARAVADGDPIHAVIKGVGTNHGGRTNALTVTNPRAQADLIRAVHQGAGVAPASVGYIEAHGTGTPVGDPIEMLGLKKAFAALSEASGDALPPGHCAVGSVKTNIGHLEGAAGMAGMVKVIAAMRHGLIPPNHDFAEPNPLLRLDGSPFRIADALAPWPPGPDGRLHAGVSAFGFGGSNGHALLESWPVEAKKARPERDKGAPVLVPLSARDGARLAVQAARLADWLDRHPDADLASVAFTLQTGRAAMPARLAVVAESCGALADRLRAFATDRTVPVADLWWTEQAAGPADTDAPAPIRKWRRKGRLDRLAAFWVGGGAVDWSRLWGKRPPPRLHLPGYPFARHRYWYPAAETDDRAGDPGRHPLLAETRAGPDLARARPGDPLLADHVVGGRSILPGMAALEIVRAAACRALAWGDAAPVILRDVVWLRPIDAEAMAAGLTVRLDPHSATSEAGTPPPFMGEVGRGPSQAPRQAAPPAALPHPNPPRSGEGVRSPYPARPHAPAGTAASGTNPRPDRDGIAFSLHPAGVPDAAPFCRGTVAPGDASPAPLDLGALRAACDGTVAADACYARLSQGGIAHGPAFRALGAVAVGVGLAVAPLRLPEGHGLNAAQWGLHPVLTDAAVQAVAALIDETDGPPGIPFAVEAVHIAGPWRRDMVGVVRRTGARRFDVTLCAPDGAVSVHLEGLSTRALDGTAAGAGAEPPMVVMAVPTWQPAPDAPPADGPATWIAFGALAGRVDGVAEAFDLPDPTDATGMQAALTAVFARLQELLRAGTPGRLVVVLPSAHPLLPALAAMMGTVALESSRVSGRVIGVDDPAALDPTALTAEGHRDGPPLVRLTTAGERLARTFTPTPAPEPVAWPRGGVVWIAGGAGGLGRLIARHLRARGVGTVVLSSRSPIPAESLPDGVVSWPVDVTDAAAVAEAARTIRARHGRIDGVVHAAGVLRDGLARGKAPEDMAAVLAPKIAGALALDAATAEDDLSAFVLFSSIASVHGNPGQVDYAAANGVLDGLAAWRHAQVAAGCRRGRTVAVNWPLWADGGMTVDAAGLTALRRRMGVTPLPTDAGLAALDAALALDAAQVAVAHGPTRAVRRFLETGDAAEPARAIPSPATDTGPALRARLVDHLRGLMGTVLDMPPQTIRPDVTFDTYGFDSIVAVEMIGHLEEGLGPLPKTLFFEYVDLNGVAGALLETHGAAVAALLAPAEAQDGDGDGDGDGPLPASPMTGGGVRQAPGPAVLKGGRDDRHAVAVIGMGGRYPGAETLDQFWQNLANGRHAFTPVPADRWPHADIAHPERDVPGKSTIQTGGFLTDIDRFDPRYFSISQRDAELMSPEVRLLLQVAVETFEDAGYSRETLHAEMGGDVGVLVGTMSNHYNLYGFANMLTRGARASGSYTGTLPNMVSYFYGLTGPSIFVDTMCSASSTAVDLAVRLLRAGQTRMVLAGGVNLLLHPHNLISSSQEHFTSNTAEVIRSFGLGADGTILGEGVGTVLLKPLRDAERDGDAVHGVILGTALTNAGVRNGFTVPSPTQQARCVRLALEDAGVPPDTISYLEAHGSGTRLGDPIEMAALHQVFGTRRPGEDTPRCAIGSVKSNVAHLLAAAGIVGLTKVLLQLRHGKIAPSLHAADLNPDIDFASSPFAVQQSLTDWPRPERVEDGQPRPLPRRAGVTSIGAGGMNSHIVVEEYRPPVESASSPLGPVLAVFSAMTPAALNTVLDRMAAWLAANPGADAAAVAHTLQVGRTALPCRLALIAEDTADLARRIDAARRGEDRRWYAPDVLAAQAPDPGAVAAAVAARDLEAVAAAWIAGAVIDWPALWGDGRPRRLSGLPTYPFARVRCWVEQDPDAPTVLNPEAFRRRLHPLIGRNTSGLGGVGFATDLRLDDLLDYAGREAGARALPAPVALDAALAAARLAGAASVTGLRDVRWSPILWGDARRLDIAVRPADGGAAGVSIAWETDAGDRFQWVEATAVSDAPAPGDAPPAPDPDAVTLEAGEIRAILAGAGIEPGPYPALPARLAVDANGRGRAVVAPPAFRQDPHRRGVTLEPEALAALHHGARLVGRRLGLAGWADLMPASLDRLCLCAGDHPLPVTEVRFALARHGDGLSGGMALLDADGAILAALSGMTWTAPARVGAGTDGPSDPDGDVAGRLRSLMADILKFDPAEIDDRVGVHALGFDSISLTDLTDRVNGAFGTALTPAVFYDLQTVGQLSREIARLRPGPSVPTDTPPAARPVPAPVAAAPRQTRRPIAVIGYAGRFPGAPDVDAFAALLRRGDAAISDLPLDRYGAAYAARMTAADFPRRGGFLDDLARFDAEFFGLSPAEAERLDPQHRLMLETAWATLESAAVRPRDLPADTGVFIGVSAHDWDGVLRDHGVAADGYVATGTSHAMLANRLSYLWDIHGPSEAIDTACSSSLVAVHRAVEALRAGRCGVALAGGVNVALSLDSFTGPHAAGMLSPDGRCKTFAAGADGYGRGEGVGAVLLKPLDAALRDGDPVRGVILGSAENHGGRAAALTAPNTRAQADLVVAAMDGIDPATIDYIEAHGTGTELGDPVEVNALTAAYERLAKSTGSPLVPGGVALGSVKTQIGHLEAAAGIAGLLKGLVCLRDSFLPAGLGGDALNPYLALEGGPFTVPRAARPWTGARRRAGVSSFGFGGTNAHVVIEDAPAPTARDPVPGPHVVVLSARAPDRLEDAARRLRSALEAPGMRLDAVAWTLQVGREPMEHRLAVVAADLDDLRRRLDGWLAGDPGAGVHRGHVRLPPGFPETRGDGAPDHTTVIARSEATTQSRAKTAHPGPGLLRPRQETPARNDGFVLASGPDAPLGDRQECVSAEASQPPPLAGTGPELAAHWCAGGAVDWRRLWPRGVPLRVALPTYPFAGERHWPLRDAAPDPSPPSPDVLDLLDDLIAGRVDATAASRRLLETEGTP